MAEKNSILIIDDSEVSIMALKDILESDYIVHIAKNGRLGLEVAERELPDAILLDIIMPEVDGYGVLVALKKNRKTSNIPVILISSLDDMRNEQKGFILGAADYVSKPFSPTVVKHRVQNQIDIVNSLLLKEQSIIQEKKKLNKALDEALLGANKIQTDLEKALMEAKDREDHLQQRIYELEEKLYNLTKDTDN